MIPFTASCFKGEPANGMVAGLAVFFGMCLAVTGGATMFEVHLLGFVITGLGTSWAMKSH